MNRKPASPVNCQDRCPLNVIPERLLDELPFTRKFDGPIVVTDTPVANEFNINSIGDVLRVTADSRKIGANACTNIGVAMYLDNKTFGDK